MRAILRVWWQIFGGIARWDLEKVFLPLEYPIVDVIDDRNKLRSTYTVDTSCWHSGGWGEWWQIRYWWVDGCDWSGIFDISMVGRCGWSWSCIAQYLGDTSLSDITVVPDAPTTSNVAVPAGTVGVAAASAVAARAAMAAVTAPSAATPTGALMIALMI